MNSAIINTTLTGKKETATFAIPKKDDGSSRSLTESSSDSSSDSSSSSSFDDN